MLPEATVSDAKVRPKIITAASLPVSLKPYAAPLALALLIVALEGLGDSGRAWLRFERAQIEAGQVWRALTGHLVHLGWYHAGLNLLGLVALLALCPQIVSAREWLRRVLLLSLLISLGLYFLAPQVGHYVGLSGVLHGLFLLGLVPMARRGDLIAAGCLLYLIGKLAWEIWAGAPLSDAQAIGGRVVTESHLFGTLAALAYGLLLGTFRQGEPQK